MLIPRSINRPSICRSFVENQACISTKRITSSELSRTGRAFRLSRARNSRGLTDPDYQPSLDSDDARGPRLTTVRPPSSNLHRNLVRLARWRCRCFLPERRSSPASSRSCVCARCNDDARPALGVRQGWKGRRDAGARSPGNAAEMTGKPEEELQLRQLARPDVFVAEPAIFSPTLFARK